jgi:hypothetical protein
MMRRLLAAIAVALVCMTAAPLAAAAAYNPFSTVCTGSGAANSSAVCTDAGSKGDPISGPHGVIMATVNILAMIAGAAAIILLIIAGFKYVTANGNSSAINSARDTIIYTLVGIVVIVLARTIIAFAIDKI